VTVGTVAKVVTLSPRAILIAPLRSAKNSRPSGAHASDVTKSASATKTLCPAGPVTVIGETAQGSGLVVVVDDATADEAVDVTVGSRGARDAPPPSPRHDANPMLASVSSTTSGPRVRRSISRDRRACGSRRTVPNHRPLRASRRLRYVALVPGDIDICSSNSTKDPSSTPTSSSAARATCTWECRSKSCTKMSPSTS
jgi:hypothetical protein